jgi:hypothetical protein
MEWSAAESHPPGCFPMVIAEPRLSKNCCAGHHTAPPVLVALDGRPTVASVTTPSRGWSQPLGSVKSRCAQLACLTYAGSALAGKSEIGSCAVCHRAYRCGPCRAAYSAPSSRNRGSLPYLAL